jgi:hypothetical protein
MILIALMATTVQAESFGRRMNEYMACLSAGTPSDLAGRDYATRVRSYRSAAARCTSERAAAVDAAVRDRSAGTPESDARRLATDIIDTLDPSSNHPVGSRP